EHIAPMDAGQRALNGQTVAAYRDFLVREYGEEAVRVLEYRYFIDLRKMVEQGQPLCPEHIYRFNVGFNNVEVQDLESLLHRLRDLSAVLQDGNWGERSLEFCLRWYDSIADAQHRFSMREVRGLMRVLRQLTGLRRLPVYVLQAWIAEIESACTSQKLCTLDREHFDQLVRIYWTPAEDWNKIFTGREILHKAIMGFYTTADKDDFKPWLDQHELLQILPQCRDTEDWENFYERLAHVVCKKHMVRAHPDDEWRVGAIIPAPNNLDSQPRWYVVTSVLDDHYGDFHYTLEPATHDSRMPFIQLYRSTASDAYAMNGWSSVEADLSPWTAPGGHNRWIADHHEFPYVKRHTLALWSAYVLKALDHHEKVEGFSPPDKSLPFPRQFVAWHQHVKEWRECLLAYQDSVEQLCETRIRELKAEVEGEALSEEELEELNAQRGVERKQWKKIRAWYQERQEVIPAVWDDMTQRNFERLQRQAAEFATMAEEYREVMLYH
ncbi:MAG: hypothetical protein KDK78_12555, partial [Chlamydiia bacterium]|nr:hypothetical protein [Chlamydiia bacterium]